MVAEQLRRLAGLDVEVVVEAVPGDDDGLSWRTRVQWAVAPDGTAGLRQHRSHDVVPVDDCVIAHPGLPDVTGQEWPDASAVEAIVSATGERLRLVSTRDGSTFADGPLLLHERAAGRDWQVTGSGFWQVHPGAADALVGAVVEGLAPEPGERALDLYAGVGLFSAALAARVGPAGHVLAVEGDETAVEDAAVNLADLPQVSVLVGRVDRALADVPAADLVVLDPPRDRCEAGGGRRDRRDLRRGRSPTWRATRRRWRGTWRSSPSTATSCPSLRAFDLFPMTHHVECVAVLSRRHVS